MKQRLLLITALFVATNVYAGFNNIDFSSKTGMYISDAASDAGVDMPDGYNWPLAAITVNNNDMILLDRITENEKTINKLLARIKELENAQQ